MTMENARELLLKIEQDIEACATAIMRDPKTWSNTLMILHDQLKDNFFMHEGLSKVLRSKER